MTNYAQHFSTRRTPQKQPVPGMKQIENSAGGFVFPVDDWTRLDRFLILGSSGGSYYATEQKLTVENAEVVVRCIKADGLRTVARIVEISQAGRAPKNDPALFALAMCAGTRDDETRKAAFTALPKVARIGTHLFNFLTYVQAFRGWGRGLREAVAAWYNEKDVDRLAYQCVKYRQRNGWTHRDALRLAHPQPSTTRHEELYHWITQDNYKGADTMPDLVNGFVLAQSAQTDQEAIQAIQNYKLTWEMLPTQFLKSPQVWDVLLPNLPMTALIRNLGRMTSIGLLKPMSEAVSTVVSKLTNQKHLRKARVHPLSVLIALKTYQQGKGMRGSLAWQPVAQVVDALDSAFYLAFDNVEPTNRRTMLALDVSGSMSAALSGMPLSCREGVAAMAMVTARVEPQHVFTVFSAGGKNYKRGSKGGWMWSGISTWDISPRQRLDDVVRRMSGLGFKGTDCSLPMLYALDQGMQIDTFIVYTDNETWAGAIHPFQALEQYRQKTGISAKLVVAGMVSNGFSIANPDDGGMLDCVGFDTATPQVISDFSK